MNAIRKTNPRAHHQRRAASHTKLTCTLGDGTHVTLFLPTAEWWARVAEESNRQPLVVAGPQPERLAV